MEITVIVLAAGQGTRMRSAQPKVLHTIGGKPMLEHVVTAAREAFTRIDHHLSSVRVVIGHGASYVKKALTHHDVRWIEQKEQLGTGHAVKQAFSDPVTADIVLVLYGDVPLIRPETLQTLVNTCGGSYLSLLTTHTATPHGYGRIVRNHRHQIQAIIEEKDASAEQKKINEINTGIMAVPAKYLKPWLDALGNNNTQKEYYLTDIIAMAAEQGVSIKGVSPVTEAEVLGINNRQQQAQIEREYQRLQAEQLMSNGVTLLDPARVDVRGQLKTGQDVTIDCNCIFEGNVTLGDNVSVGAGCILRNTTIAANCQIAPYSLIDDSHLNRHCHIGPFARLRPGTKLEESVKIGNFVETKKAVIGAGTKVNHLSYIGDATLGMNVNVGAGAITCNYDGVNKYKTTIGDNAFIGSNTALVAPVQIDASATVGAGSTITDHVADGQLAIARNKQQNIDDWTRPVKKK